MSRQNNMTDERRNDTKNRIFRLFYESKVPLSKQQAANKIRCSMPTLYKNMGELLNLGYIEEAETFDPRGGRPAIGYRVNADCFFAIGISISANHLRFLAVNIKYKELAYRKIRTDIKDKDASKLMSTELESFIDDNSLDRAKLLGVGIVIPGVVDSTSGSVLHSPTLRTNRLSLDELKKNIKYPVYFGNDSTCGGIAEMLSMSMDLRAGNYVYLFLENGVGGSIFHDGKPYMGDNGRSGEFGHMCIVPDGKPCNCGKKGCLEAYCSAMRISTELGISTEEFFSGLEEDNPKYKQIWEDVLAKLAVAIDNLRMAFDCPVIIGGFLSGYVEKYLSELKELVRSRSIFDSDADYIIIEKNGDKTGMTGAATFFIQQFIESV